MSAVGEHHRQRTHQTAGACSSAGDPYGEVRDAWHAKETLRSIYDIDDANLRAPPPSTSSPKTSRTPPCHQRSNRLGRTIWNWRHQISNWHAARVTNAPTEAANNLVKRVKRAAFGVRPTSNNYRIRALLYEANPTGPSSTPSLRPETAKSRLYVMSPSIAEAAGCDIKPRSDLGSG